MEAMPFDVMNEVYKYLPHSFPLTTARLVNKKMENATRSRYLIRRANNVADVANCDDDLTSCHLKFETHTHHMNIWAEEDLSVEIGLVGTFNYGMAIPEDERHRFANFLRITADIIDSQNLDYYK